jgi:hypothetical protein
MPIAKTQPDSLTSVEVIRLAELEATVEKHIGGFREAGTALAEIRASRLYRMTHDTFDAYLSGVWGIKKSSRGTMDGSRRRNDHARDFPNWGTSGERGAGATVDETARLTSRWALGVKPSPPHPPARSLPRTLPKW